jgi:glycopeptide antibiotics resistance protein
VLKKVYLWAAIFWSAIIAFLCLVQLHNAPFKSVSNLDKLVHIFFHFVFTILWFLYFNIQFHKQKYSKSLLISVLFSFLFGIAIEILQEYCTASRHADFYDVFANSFGAMLAFGLLFCWNTFSLKQMKK